jgi:DNA-binding MarR family transcriptional regulator
MSHAVLRALELSAYRELPEHDTSFIAKHVGISSDDVEHLLQQLVEAGLVHRESSHFGVQEILTVDTRMDAQKNRQLKEYWAREAVARFALGNEPAETLFSFNLFAVSEEGYRQIRDLHLEYYDRVRAIIDQSPRADRVLLMNLQLLPMQRKPQP